MRPPDASQEHLPSRTRAYQALAALALGALVLVGALAAPAIPASTRTNGGKITPSRSNATASVGSTKARATTGMASWLYMPSGFAGKVLHWTSRGLSYERTDADPSNGKLLNGDFWMALDAHGQPTAYRYRYTYPNGQLHQEMYQYATTGVMVLGADYRHPNVPVPPGWCVSPVQTTYSTLVGQYPLFAIAAELGPMMGLHDTGMRALTVTPSSTASPPGAEPIAREEIPTTADVWASSQFDSIDMAIGTTQLSLGPLGRIVYQATTWATLSGRTELNSWTVYGPLDVYAPSAVPPTIFKAPADIGKECAS